MKYTVRIEDRIYQVEISDLHARPIIAIVDGVLIEVWPESEIIASGQTISRRPVNIPQKFAPAEGKVQTEPAAGSASDLDQEAINAPIPGVIISILVRPGDEVKAGQELCVVEAMKMKNIIRAPHEGKIDEIFVSVNQSVNHNDPLMKFAT